MARRQPGVPRIRGELKATIRSYLESRNGQPATIAEIQAAAERQFGPVPRSSVRSGLQDERYFERVARGVFRLQSAS
jgi:hypothetical protein